MTLPNELHPGFLASAGGSGDLGDPIEQSLRNKGSGQDVHQDVQPDTPPMQLLRWRHETRATTSMTMTTTPAASAVQ